MNELVLGVINMIDKGILRPSDVRNEEIRREVLTEIKKRLETLK